MRALKANPLLPRLPPLAAAQTHSDPRTAGSAGSNRSSPNMRPRRPRAPPILPSHPVAAAAPLHFPRLRTPTNCNFAELQALSPRPSPSLLPSPTKQPAKPVLRARRRTLLVACPGLLRARPARSVPIRAGAGRCACAMLEMPAPRNGRMMWNRIQCKFAILNIN